MKKQSSIEWLVEQIASNAFVKASDQIEIIQQAKQMHKQEMVEFATEYDEYCHNSFVQNQYKSIKSAEQYYKETYETK